MMVTVFPKSANQPNKMALTICNCFCLMRDWKLERLANGKTHKIFAFNKKVNAISFYSSVEIKDYDKSRNI